MPDVDGARDEADAAECGEILIAQLAGRGTELSVFTARCRATS